MLHELDLELKKNHDLDATDLRKTASNMLSKQFVYRFKGGQDRAIFLQIKDCQNYFLNLFHALGYKMVVADDYGYIGLIPEFAFRKMKLVDTLFLLVARLVYEEGMKSLQNLSDLVSITHEDFLLRYETLTGRERPDNNSKFNESLSSLQRFGIVKLESKGSDPFINIYPGIISLITTDVLKQIEEFNNITIDDETDEEVESEGETL